jgi:uncharacterized protein (UPF0335 family)
MNTSATEGQLRSYVERTERLNDDAKAISDDKKELSAEIKGQGYCVKTIGELVKRRAADKDKLAEADAMLEMYSDVMGM